MAVPKRKISKQRANSRSANWKLILPNLIECSNCHEKIQGHQVCPHCGYYKGKPIVVKKEKAE
jgi:large subunit ribosomal protein L32